MGAPQGLFYYSGIQALLRGSFALTDDVAPSIGTIYIPPQDTPLPDIGTLTIAYGGDALVLPDCRVMNVHFDVGDDGKEVWAITVADARWRWKYYRISGSYNLKDDNQNPKASTIKDSRDLAALLFQALNVQKYDLGDMPGGNFPEKNWDYDRADTELSALCSGFGCKIVPQSGGSFKIVAAGNGAALKRDGLTLNYSDAVNPPETPQSIVFVSGHNLYQTDFALEAVGMEFGGEIKPIDELSYAPKRESGTNGPWEYADIPHFMCVDPDVNIEGRTRNRDLAKMYVFRLFRIITPVKLPGEKVAVKNLREILPITDRQIFRAKVTDIVQTLPAIVYGNYYRESHEERNTEEEEQVEPKLAKTPEGKWHGGVTVISEKGLIHLDAPCYRLLDDGRQQPGIIFLRTSVSYRDPKTYAFKRTEIERKLSRQPNGTPKLYLLHDEINFVASDRDQTGKDNYQDNMENAFQDVPFEDQKASFPGLKFYADYFIDGQLREMQLRDETTVKVAGFVGVQLDGAIRQVVYEVDDSGKAWTTIARNTEVLGHYPSRAERAYNIAAASIADKADQQNQQMAKMKGNSRRVFQ